MTTIVDLRAMLRVELSDSSALRWADADLDRHLLRAARELSLALPMRRRTELPTTSGDRVLALASLADLLRVAAVEYPLAAEPPELVRFQRRAGELLLLTDEPPTGDPAAVYWDALHQLDASGTTLDAAQQEVVLLGAAGYAAQQLALASTDRVNLGGSDTPQRFAAEAERRLAAFRRLVLALGRRRVGVRRLQRPALAEAEVTAPWS